MKNKVPIRKCVGCQKRKEKKELIRIVRSPEGEFSLDTTGKKQGRGAYICPTEECLEKVLKNRGLERSFKMGIKDEVKEKIKKQVITRER